eukprot:TRINITY_DN457_c1_g1_i1.p1 TRINITY_DN457_c1_g1~~TRINITY_DN457_c1_g1_i1.p1  ORF type:complete len:154 (+),score=42.19 TRINITY_DN457_c1_g1_i1:50-511(+)
MDTTEAVRWYIFDNGEKRIIPPFIMLELELHYQNYRSKILVINNRSFNLNKFTSKYFGSKSTIKRKVLNQTSTSTSISNSTNWFYSSGQPGKELPPEIGKIFSSQNLVNEPFIVTFAKSSYAVNMGKKCMQNLEDTYLIYKDRKTKKPSAAKK